MRFLLSLKQQLERTSTIYRIFSVKYLFFKIINILIVHGKKGKAENIILKVLKLIKQYLLFIYLKFCKKINLVITNIQKHDVSFVNKLFLFYYKYKLANVYLFAPHSVYDTSFVNFIKNKYVRKNTNSLFNHFLQTYIHFFDINNLNDSNSVSFLKSEPLSYFSILLDPYYLLANIFLLNMPVMDIRTYKKRGRKHPIPKLISPNRRINLAIKWLVESCFRYRKDGNLRFVLNKTKVNYKKRKNIKEKKYVSIINLSFAMKFFLEVLKLGRMQGYAYRRKLTLYKYVLNRRGFFRDFLKRRRKQVEFFPKLKAMTSYYSNVNLSIQNLLNRLNTPRLKDLKINKIYSKLSYLSRGGFKRKRNKRKYFAKFRKRRVFKYIPYIVKFYKVDCLYQKKYKELASLKRRRRLKYRIKRKCLNLLYSPKTAFLLNN